MYSTGEGVVVLEEAVTMLERELLDIAQAAAFLGVSQTSLRRWTNAGRLPCYRVGGRRERRFLRADLVGFLERAGGAAAPAIPAADGHLFGLYRSPAARERQAVSFLLDALTAGSPCVLVAESRVRARILARLRQHRSGVRKDVATGRLVLSAYESRPTEQLEYWESRFAAARGTSLRVVADVSGGRLGKRPIAELVDYERMYDELSRHFGVTTLCQYDARRLSGVDTAHLLEVHGGRSYAAERRVVKQ
jgi:transcriptional repressor of dcmA and dcmR